MTETLFHLVSDRHHACVVAWRTDTVASMRPLRSLWTEVFVALDRASMPRQYVSLLHAAALVGFIGGGAPSPHERSFLLYWMLSAVPWPQFVTLAPPPAVQYPAVAGLGAVFERRTQRVPGATAVVGGDVVVMERGA